MTSLSRWPIAAVLLLVAGGCSARDASKGVQTLVPPDQFLDYNGFVCNVQPTLIRRCSYLACHGEASHALRVYSVGKLRESGATAKADRDAPLTADEIELNFSSASGIVYAVPAAERDPANPTLNNDPLLLKPLAARFGGSEHHGVAVFPQFGAATPSDDADYTALVRWVGGEKEPTPPTKDCQDLFTALGVPPRSP